MNIAMVRYLLGWMLTVESAFLLLPALTSAVYREHEGMIYLVTALLCFGIGRLLSRKKPENTRFYAREGFVTVALCWIVLAMTGALPYWLTGEFPHYIDALFEAVSGFTTTGATVAFDIEALSHATLLWRSLTHWIGGMGVLVFILAILPLAGGHALYLMRAESPGPSVNKLSPHLRDTAVYLYAIYFGLTAGETVLLLFGGMPFFDAVNVALSTAGTGGFGIWNDSIAHYDSYYLQGVISVFMILFGINFSLYFLALTRKFKQALKSEELRLYLGVIACATLLIGVNTARGWDTLLDALHHALFQVASIITTTGFATVDFDLWPAFSKGLLVLLMFIGACAGSTGGGIKCSRILTMCKSVKKELLFLIHPRSVRVNQIDGRRVQHEVVRSINVFLIVYVLIFSASFLLLCLTNSDMTTNFTAVAATLNNVGPGLSQVGPTCTFSFFSIPAKLLLIFDMLAGRLELFPMLLLFLPATWRKNR